VTSSGYLNKSEPYSGKRADPARSARSMRGNHLGSLSYLNAAIAFGVWHSLTVFAGYQRHFGGRVHPGRDFVSNVCQS